ncbi:MAG: hypothetical protein ACOYL6_10485 [Bacteriovoracaceae bacterium]
MNKDNIVQLHSLRGLPELVRETDAETLVPHLLYIGRNTKKEINMLNSQLEVFKGNAEKREAIQNKIHGLTQKWSEKMKRLGTTPVSLLKVKIVTDRGNFLWEFPHDRLFRE